MNSGSFNYGFGRHHDLVNPYNVAVSRIVSDVFFFFFFFFFFFLPMTSYKWTSKIPDIRFYLHFLRSGLWAWWAKHAYYPRTPDYTLYSGAPVYWSEQSGPSYSKLTMSFINDSLKFTLSDTQICWNVLLKKKMWVAKATHIFFQQKNITILYIESAKTVKCNEMTLNKLVKLTTLWTTGPWFVIRLRIYEFGLQFGYNDHYSFANM